MNTTVKKLRRQMLSAQFSEDIIRLMSAIARTGEPDAIRVIAASWTSRATSAARRSAPSSRSGRP